MMKRDKSLSIVPEITKRFKNKNVKISSFSMEVIAEAYKNTLFTDEATFKSIFRGYQDNLSHANKEVKDRALELLKETFKLASDDPSSFVRNIKGARPILLKEIKEILTELDKASGF
jgi:hypothetical protein